MSQQDGVIAELVGFNHNMHSTVRQLDARIAQLECDITQFRTLTASSAVTRALPASAPNGDPVPKAGSPGPPVQKDAKKAAKASTKRPVADAFAGEGVTMPGRTKYRKKLEVKIPGKTNLVAPGVGLPTPQTSVSVLSSSGRHNSHQAGPSDSTPVGSRFLIPRHTAYPVYARTDRPT